MTKNLTGAALAMTISALCAGACDRKDDRATRAPDPTPITAEAERRADQAGRAVERGVDQAGRAVERGVDQAGRAMEPSTAPPAGATMAFGSALDGIAAARCEREARCDNVGTGRRYESEATCRTVVRNEFSRDINPADCRGGIDRGELTECIQEVKQEDCGNPLDTLQRLAACRTSDLCRAERSVSMR